MGRAPRIDIQDHYYHILNRANGRMQIFHKPEDYILFEEILEDAVEAYDVHLVAYCVMPNHFHLVVESKKDGSIQKFMQWLTLTHTQRLRAKTNTIGYGHVYQGRYKSFIVDSDNYLQALLIYVEQNPLRARLVKDLKNWKWGSYYRRLYGSDVSKKLLTTHEYQQHSDFVPLVNTALNDETLNTIRNSINKGQPLGEDNWVAKMVKKFGLEATTRSRGRPRKGT